MNLIGPPVPPELLQFLIWYVTWRCDLDLWTFDLGIMSRDATWCSIPVLSLNWIPLTIPELGWLQFSIDRQLKVPIFTFLGDGKEESDFKFRLSNHQKALPWPERRIMTYCAWGCVQRCDLWSWRRNEKRTETFMRQTGYLPRPPTST